MDSRNPSQAYNNRFHYPQNSRITRPGASSHIANEQFPPHPSVRIPQNVRTAPRQAQAGIGDSPRRPRGTESPRQMRAQPAPRPQQNGHSTPAQRFPQPPNGVPRAPHGQQSYGFQPPSSNRYNMHDSYVSSMSDEPTPKVTPKTTPGSRSPRHIAAAQARDSASVYADSTAPPSPLAAYPSSKVMHTDTFPTPMPPPVNTASFNASLRPRPGDISPVSSRTAAMNALGAAIAAGFSSQAVVTPTVSDPPSRTFSPVRMPFGKGEDSDSPNETQEELAPPRLRELTPETKSHLAEQTEATPSTLKSKKSNDALLGLGIKQPNGGLSEKRGVEKRPPRLDIDAVRDMEARGSTTSLTELIRRATKLASNLDRGKTASRLGMLQLYGSSERLGQMGAGNRDSTMSDMISAFPAPAAQTTPRRDTYWNEKNGQYENMDGSDTSKKRRCCGMSLPVFIAVFVIVIVLVAAAVLIPVFLILVPKQHQNHGPNLSQCAVNYPCGNGGTSIVSLDACNCVCLHGFTGAHCDIAPATGCSSLSVKDGHTIYTNATMGTDLVPLFQDAGSQFDVPLNSSTILSLFSSSDLSCDSENNIVDFNTTSSDSKPSKRFITFPDIEPVLNPVPTDLATLTTKLIPRQTVVSTDGIVFATSTAATKSSSSASASTGAAETSTVLSGSAPTQTSSPSSAPSSASSPPADISSKQLEFAKIVVLYALEQSQTLSIAVNAKNQILDVFETGNKTEIVEVGFGTFEMKANFQEFTISTGGVTVGGSS